MATYKRCSFITRRRLPEAAARRRQQRLFGPPFHGQAPKTKHAQALSHFALVTLILIRSFFLFLFPGMLPIRLPVGKKDNLPTHQPYVQCTDYELILYSFTNLSPTRPSSYYFLQSTNDDRPHSDGRVPLFFLLPLALSTSPLKSPQIKNIESNQTTHLSFYPPSYHVPNLLPTFAYFYPFPFAITPKPSLLAPIP